jgi:hypothetical protein
LYSVLLFGLFGLIVLNFEKFEMASSTIHGLGIHDAATLEFPFAVNVTAIDCLMTAFKSALSDSELYQRSLEVEPRGGRKPVVSVDAESTLPSVSPAPSVDHESTNASSASAATVALSCSQSSSAPSSPTSSSPVAADSSPLLKATPSADELESERRSVLSDERHKSSLYDRFRVKIEETNRQLVEMRANIECEDDDHRRLEALKALQAKEVYLLALKTDLSNLVPNRPQPPPRAHRQTSAKLLPASTVTTTTISTVSANDSPISTQVITTVEEDAYELESWESFEYSSLGVATTLGDEEVDEHEAEPDEDAVAELVKQYGSDVEVLKAPPPINFRHTYRSPSVHSYEPIVPSKRRPPPRRSNTTEQRTLTQVATIRSAATACEADESSSSSSSPSSSSSSSSSTTTARATTPELLPPTSTSDTDEDSQSSTTVEALPTGRTRAKLPTSSPFAPVSLRR